MGLPTISSVVLKPNVGDVVNQNQGFVLEVTVDNSTGLAIYDTVLQVTNVSPGITVGVGLNVPIKLPKISAGSTHTIPIVFETDETITTGNKTIKLKAEGYVGGPEWLEIFSAPPAIFPVGIQGAYPVWSDTFTETVKIYAE